MNLETIRQHMIKRAGGASGSWDAKPRFFGASGSWDQPQQRAGALMDQFRAAPAYDDGWGYQAPTDNKWGAGVKSLINAGVTAVPKTLFRRTLPGIAITTAVGVGATASDAARNWGAMKLRRAQIQSDKAALELQHNANMERLQKGWTPVIYRNPFHTRMDPTGETNGRWTPDYGMFVPGVGYTKPNFERNGGIGSSPNKNRRTTMFF